MEGLSSHTNLEERYPLRGDRTEIDIDFKITLTVNVKSLNLLLLMGTFDPSFENRVVTKLTFPQSMDYTSNDIEIIRQIIEFIITRIIYSKHFSVFLNFISKLLRD